MAQPRGYNPDKHSALPYVDKQFKNIVDQVAEKTHWSKKTTVEIAIERLGLQYEIKSTYTQ